MRHWAGVFGGGLLDGRGGPEIIAITYQSVTEYPLHRYNYTGPRCEIEITRHAEVPRCRSLQRESETWMARRWYLYQHSTIAVWYPKPVSLPWRELAECVTRRLSQLPLAYAGCCAIDRPRPKAAFPSLMSRSSCSLASPGFLRDLRDYCVGQGDAAADGGGFLFFKATHNGAGNGPGPREEKYQDGYEAQLLRIVKYLRTTYNCLAACRQPEIRSIPAAGPPSLCGLGQMGLGVY
jgi:hypothetical protein